MHRVVRLLRLLVLVVPLLVMLLFRVCCCYVVTLGNELNLGTVAKPGSSQWGKGNWTPALDAGHLMALGDMLRRVYGSVGGGNISSPWVIGPDATHGAVGPSGPRKTQYFFGQVLRNLTGHGVDVATCT